MELNDVFLDVKDIEINAKFIEDMVIGVLDEEAVVAALRKRQI